MIRPTLKSDVERLVQMARGTGVFRDLELLILREGLDVMFDELDQSCQLAICYELDGRVAGFASYGQADMTDRSWYLFWIIVDRSQQSRGIGSALLRYVEEEVRAKEGRILLIETSSLPIYDATRGFYKKHGYEQVATIPDYYADDDDLCVFRRRLNAHEGAPS